MLIDTFPPSPALSACDSLDGDDLDAFLAAQGPLSQWATPPLKEAASVEVQEILEDESDTEDCDGLDYGLLAFHFADETAVCPLTHLRHAALIGEILRRAQLPPELLAVAHNIVRRYTLLRPSSLSTWDVPADLLVASALALAISYTDDHPPNSNSWSRYVCDGRWSASDIDRATLHVLITLDWALHGLASPQALKQAMGLLGQWMPVDDPVVVDVHPQLKLEPLKISIETASACWAAGQLTPHDTPPDSAVGVPQAYFLPLL